MSTKIEWTQETWNPVMGCTKVSQGCKNCYAERLWPKVDGARVKREGGAPRAFTEVACHPERLDAPLHWAKPRRIFVNSMSDLFHEDVPDAFILQVFDIMRQCENGYSNITGRTTRTHTFQILTKRPERMRDFCTQLRFAQNDDSGLYLAKALPHNGFNPMRALRNVWLGVSVEDQATADERIPLLLQTPAAVRFVSYEPALGPVDFFGHFFFNDAPSPPGAPPRAIVNWLIAGGESGPNARPAHPDWFRSARDQCAAAGVPFFFKQWGNWIHEDQYLDEFVSVSDVYINDEDRSAAIHAWPTATECPSSWSVRIGKKAAGRLLDGRTHDEYPA